MFNKQLTPKQREKVERIIAQGKQSFVWKRGVLGWGLPVFVMSTAWRYYDPLYKLHLFHRHRPLEHEDLLVYVLVMLPIWLIVGYGWGLWMWNHAKSIVRQNR